MIRLDNISVLFNPKSEYEIIALRGISFSLNPGQWLTIVGPNGSGKSTLLRVLAGEIAPSSGHIFINGLDITSLGQHERASFIQFIEQNTDRNLVPSMTVEENLLLSGQQNRFPRLRAAQTRTKKIAIEETLTLFEMGLETRMNTQVRLLSGGQRAAIVIASALLRDVKIFLLDEFNTSLDPKAGPLLLQKVRELAWLRNITVLMVTHNIGDALSCAENVMVINRGQIFRLIDRNDLSPDRLSHTFAEAILEK